eukprot:PITA_32916
MEPNKAPGPDGFSIHFYRIFWGISKDDQFRMIKGFLQKSKVGGSTNSTFLALIPKEANLVAFDRFRPISLCNASYKILTKLLENRIKPLLEKIISPNQGIRAIKGTIPINHTLFVDDSLLMGGASIKIEKAFNKVIQSFYKVSGALVNRRKSIVYGWSVDQKTIHQIAQALGFTGYASWDELNYLSLPLTLGTSKALHWMKIISKIKAK